MGFPFSGGGYQSKVPLFQDAWSRSSTVDVSSSTLRPRNNEKCGALRAAGGYCVDHLASQLCAAAPGSLAMYSETSKHALAQLLRGIVLRRLTGHSVAIALAYL